MQILSSPISALNIRKSPKFSHLTRNGGRRNVMVMSDFRLEVEIRPFRACTMKNMQYNPYLWPNRQNICRNRGRGTQW